MGMTGRGRLDPSSFHGCLTGDRDECVLDLSDTRFVTPLGVVGVAVVAHGTARRGVPVRFRSPRDAHVANYLSRARLPRVLSDLGIGHDLPRVRERDLGDGLLELQRFSSGADVERLTRVLHRAARRRHPSIADSLFRSVGEAADNVTQHARAEHGYMLAQRIPSTGRLHFAVGDAGVGFLATLRSRGASSDLDALDLALRGGVSSIDDDGRGFGLRGTADGLARLGGHLWVLSGTARRMDGRGRRRATADLPLPGSLVEGALST